MRKSILAFLLLACAAAQGFAQSTPSGGDYPRYEFFAGFSANGYFKDADNLTINNQPASPFFSDAAGGNSGVHLSLTGNVHKNVGLKADFSAYFNRDDGRVTVRFCPQNVCTEGTQDFRVRSRALYFLFGPEFKARNRTRVTPFAHALLGGVRSHSEFNTSGAIVTLADSDTNSGFASAFGGGIDIRASRRASVRLLADYAPTFLREADTGGRSRQDHVRLSLGILFH